MKTEMRLDELDFLGDKVCMRLYQRDIKTVDDFINSDVDTLKEIEGLGLTKMYRIVLWERDRLLNESAKVRMGE